MGKRSTQAFAIGVHSESDPAPVLEYSSGIPAGGYTAPLPDGFCIAAQSDNFGTDTEDIPLEGTRTATIALTERIKPTVVVDITGLIRNRKQPDDSQTMIAPPTSPVAGLHPKSADELPVAILLVTGGRMKGEVLPVPQGRSTLGRSEGNRIRMPHDAFVSRHAHVVFSHHADADDMVSVSPAQEGDGTGIAYLNGEPLLTPAALKYGDRIRLTNQKGNSDPTELLFIPICGVEGHPFSWQHPHLD